jgi:hypothetical protein
MPFGGPHAFGGAARFGRPHAFGSAALTGHAHMRHLLLILIINCDGKWLANAWM